MSNSLRPHELQQARLPCPPLSPGVCSNSCSVSRWCHPTISFSAAPFSFCLHSFPASGCFPISRLFALFIFWNTEFLLPPLLRHLENSCLLRRLSLLEALDRRMGWCRPLVQSRRLGAQTWSGQNWRQGKQFFPRKCVNTFSYLILTTTMQSSFLQYPFL